jgi:uncharacterized protein (TIGR03435 family)
MQFEAASVKLSRGDTKGTGGYTKSGQFIAPNATLKGLTMLAYNLHESEFSGAPSWFDSDHFDVFAKAPPRRRGPTSETGHGSLDLHDGDIAR